MLKVRAHTCYLGKTGYSSHAREFFRELSNHVDLRVRNFTWDSNPEYLDERDTNIIDKITLTNPDGGTSDYPISHSFPNIKWKKINNDFNPDVDIVLMDMDHHYFYEEYNSKIKIAYTVWESTELPENFFNQLLKFDYLWVVTEWHREMAMKQGYPNHRIFVVNEGVNKEFFDGLERNEPEEYRNNRFKFIFFGRWDYRKSVPEIIDSFIKAFPNNEPIDLILSADNPYSVDGMNSTEERLSFYGFNDPRIKVKHFVSRDEYISYIKKGNVLVTCARSEGWNIPLIETMAAGTPTIYSNWGAQLEFASGKGSPVRIKEELPASIGADLGFAGRTPGLYAEPDYDNLIEVLRDCYFNYESKKISAEEKAKEIIKNYSWENIGKQGYKALLSVSDLQLEKYDKEDAAVILSHADTPDKISTLKRSLLALKRQGYFTIISSHISIPEDILKICDYFICETDNPIVTHEEYGSLSNTVPVHYLRYPDFEVSYSFDFNHGYAALRLILNGARVAKSCGFNKTHFVNYDYVIDDENTLLEHSKLLNENSIVAYKWNQEKSINSAFFSGLSDDILRVIEPINSKQSYFKYPGIVILEDFLYECFDEGGLKMYTRMSHDISKKNILNSITLPTYPQIKTKNGKNSYLYLGTELNDGKNYICAIGNEEPLEGKIIKGDSSFDFSVGAYPMNFYPISDSELDRGVVVMIPKYNQIFKYDKKTKKASIIIRNKDLILNLNKQSARPTFNINFIDGAFIEIKNAEGRIFDVLFIDKSNNNVYYSCELENNTWARCSIKYYKDWLIKIIDKSTGETYEESIDLKEKRVLISLESSSLGDSIAWFPHIEKFRKKHGCEVIVSTFKNELFEKNYPEIRFVTPGQIVNNLYAIYRIGWFYNGNEFNKDCHPRDFKNIPMQATTTDILGLPHTDLRADIVVKETDRPIEEKYVCIAVHSTAQAKYWNNPEGWNDLVKWLNESGNKVVLLSLEENGYMGNKNPEGVIYVEGEKTLDRAITYLKNCEMFIGIGSGLSWLSWSLDVPTVVISGFSNPTTEFSGDNVIRIFNSNVCNSCFNRERLDAGDWNWCPDLKGTDRQFECTKSISSSYVIEKIKEYLEKDNENIDIDAAVRESYSLGMVQNHKEIYEAAKFFKTLGVKNFMEIGTDQGGTFAIWSKLSENGKRISVDLPHGPYGVNTYNVNERDFYLKSLGNNVTTIHGSSHDENIKENVKSILDGDLLDFLFIDGDHTYEGVKKDYHMYKEFVKDGGWIGFHDTKDTEYHRNANCRVDKLWNEMKGNKIDFIDEESNFGGIGFIQNKKYKSCMMIHNYFGERRIMMDEYKGDKLFFIKKQIEYLSKNKHNIDHIIFSINMDNTVPYIELIKKAKEIIPDRIQNATTEIMLRKNIGMSYGAFSSVYEKYRKEFDYYFFVEDDYLFNIDYFDSEMIHILNTKDNPGYLCGIVRDEKEGFPVHAGNSIGVASSLALEAVFSKYNKLPHNEENFGEYRDEESNGQIDQTHVIHNMGFSVFDIRDYYFIYHLHPDGGYEKLFTDNKDEIIVPTQRIIENEKRKEYTVI